LYVAEVALAIPALDTTVPCRLIVPPMPNVPGFVGKLSCIVVAELAVANQVPLYDGLLLPANVQKLPT